MPPRADCLPPHCFSLVEARARPAPRIGRPASGPPKVVPPAPEPPLDVAGPAVDLLLSQALLHLHRAGLVIPFASEGFRKYSQEYGNPWRAIVTIGDRTGRTLGSTASTLRFPVGWRNRRGHRGRPPARRLGRPEAVRAPQRAPPQEPGAGRRLAAGDHDRAGRVAGQRRECPRARDRQERRGPSFRRDHSWRKPADRG